ncbi:MAG TPA: SPOR domain-containing protein [Gaiellaceae bacterium]|nr:SPOR domain-containing protein [Gaiellaceae bacterium]
MNDDWRIRIELPEEEHADSLHGRIGEDLRTEEARKLADELQGRRLAVSRDGNELFVYASSQPEAERALGIIEAELAEEGVEARASAVERWLHDEERWSNEAPQETWEEEERDRGYAPWEVRIERETHAEAQKLAEELDSQGYDVVRRWRYLIVGAASEEEARELARRLQGEAELGGEVVWEESLPQGPFAIFRGVGGS